MIHLFAAHCVLSIYFTINDEANIRVLDNWYLKVIWGYNYSTAVSWHGLIILFSREIRFLTWLTYLHDCPSQTESTWCQSVSQPIASEPGEVMYFFHLAAAGHTRKPSGRAVSGCWTLAEAKRSRPEPFKTVLACLLCLSSDGLRKSNDLICYIESHSSCSEIKAV